jgi:hypothetical protein
MTTLLGVFHGTRCVKTCDARCYDARGPGLCQCICGGKNHGVGEQQARANVAAGVGLKRADLEFWCAMVRRDDIDELIVIDRTRVTGLVRARSLAEHDLYMRKHQLELPFMEPTP